MADEAAFRAEIAALSARVGWARQVAHLRRATRTFPEDPLGPDELLSEARPMWPRRAHVEFHYAHPVIRGALH